MGAWASRESFTDAEVSSAIQTFAPSANKEVYTSVVSDFNDTVVKGSAESITPQAVDAYLGQQGSLSPTEKSQLRPILLQVFGVKQGPADLKEAGQIRFQPDGNALQPKMGSLLPIEDNAPPGTYVTADPEPVLPDTKKMPKIPTLNRGGSGEAEAYTWDLASYQQADVAGQYPSRGIPPATIPPKNVREGMSTMAGTTTITNEIYGPRVPKERGAPPKPTGDANGLNGSQIYPQVYGPSSRPPAKAAQTGLGDITGQDTMPPTAFQIPALPTTEPVPFLADFSKFQK